MYEYIHLFVYILVAFGFSILYINKNSINYHHNQNENTFFTNTMEDIILKNDNNINEKVENSIIKNDTSHKKSNDLLVKTDIKSEERKTSFPSNSSVPNSGNLSMININKTPKSSRRPPLSMIRTRGSVIKSADSFINTSSPSGREFVYSLHQNNKLTLLYGKNNVSISTFDDNKILKGYLSLHKEFSGFVIVKWTPNELMNINNSQSTTGTSTSNSSSSLTQTTTAFPFTLPSHPMDILVLAKHVISFNMKNIAYIHVHQKDDIGMSTVVFVDTDGSQQASFSFVNSKNLIQFIGTLESCLDPYFKLDPPMIEDKETQEKYLPNLKKKSSNTTSKASSVTSEEDGKNTQVNDYIFRVIFNTQMKNKIYDMSGKMKLQSTGFSFNTPINNNNLSKYSNFELPKSAPAFMSNKSITSLSTEQSTNYSIDVDDDLSMIQDNVTTNISNALIFMKQRILTRAFLGWLNYCRHIKTVRKHLLNIVTIDKIKWYDDEEIEESNSGMVTKEYWNYLRENKNNPKLWETFIGKVYHYGIDNEIRKEAWLYLLQVLSWDEELKDKIEIFKINYDKDKLNWLEIENIVIQRDKEAFISARQRHFNGSGIQEDDDSESNSINSHHFENTSFGEIFNDDSDSGNKGIKTIYEDTQCDEKNQEEEDLINNFGTNLHRIEKDVERCDRSNQFFKKASNLKKLKRIMCSYVWRNLEEGYVQGMCDIAAPLLVIFEDEVIVLECFSKLMERMRLNFPQETGMDDNFKYLRHLVEVTDPELFTMIMAHGDFTHLYFSYRWFLLDFKRELSYDGVYRLWEIIWSSNVGGLSKYFQLFFALSLLTANRYIIIENAMDFTDVIKFFNDMAEKHDTQKLIVIARAHLKDFRKFIIDNCSDNSEKES
ncbi:Small G protein signaling modulator 2 [Strongyloides ratti]|uniref:Small G protein signaling modulator 2 n=1 Tax=Strongyloides ratti TaxID=34506 RepID=A0A090MXU8_STRRB|nr:Small G protein signaling modulator 2 [Strongyloides ratti]CEF66059.2 Small G protein signaling modulator 2 [Strongyloides ratti]